jgi:hypothetical protein
MKAWLAPLLAVAVALAACSKVTQENFAKIQDGMSFVNGKVALKSFDKPGATGK